ncbi:Nucleotidyltransferase domain containing protein [Trypanosoma brucei equiperdum]|uniref:Nucleotidyltransferase domain containing protein n=1 Tax=Trypanosoma brucei equiperdum TaxID=630700 RepID=A0A3L6L5J3_9TRYP|nr:Nucleotidyltransferase domain containing protein [Trypanosoma brucei equiperdum]
MSFDSKPGCNELEGELHDSPIDPQDSSGACVSLHERQIQHWSPLETPSSPSDHLEGAESVRAHGDLFFPLDEYLSSEVVLVPSRHVSQCGSSSADVVASAAACVSVAHEDLSESTEHINIAQTDNACENSSGSDVCTQLKDEEMAQANSPPQLCATVLPVACVLDEISADSPCTLNSVPITRGGFIEDNTTAGVGTGVSEDTESSNTVERRDLDHGIEEPTAKSAKRSVGPAKDSESSLNGIRPPRKVARGRAAETTKTQQVPQRARTAAPPTSSTLPHERILDDPQHGRWPSASGISSIDHAVTSETSCRTNKGKSNDGSRKQSSRVGPKSNNNNNGSASELGKGSNSLDGGVSGDKSGPARPATPHRSRRHKARQQQQVEETFGPFGFPFQRNMMLDSMPDGAQRVAEHTAMMLAQKQQLLYPVPLQGDTSKMIDVSGGTPHWSMLPSYYFVSSLQIYVDTCLGLRGGDRQERHEFVSRIQRITTKVLGPRARLRMHGSITTDLALASSDIDILVVGYEPLAPLQAIQQLSKAIQSISGEELEGLSLEPAEGCSLETEVMHQPGNSSSLRESTGVVSVDNNVVDTTGSGVEENLLAMAVEPPESDCILRVEEEEAEYRLQIERDYALSTRVGPNAAAVALHSCIPSFTSAPLPPLPPLGRRRLYVPTVDGPLYQVQTIISTRVPVIKVTEKMTGLRCDISFAGGEHWRSMQLTNRLLKRYPTSRGLILFLKHCVRQMGIGDSQPGDMTSFAIYLLVHHFFNEISKHLEETLREQIRRQQQVGDGAQPCVQNPCELDPRNPTGGRSSPCVPSLRVQVSPSAHHGSGTTSPADQKPSSPDDRFPVVTGMLLGQFLSRQQQHSNQQGGNSRLSTEGILKSFILSMESEEVRGGAKGVDEAQLPTKSGSPPNQIAEALDEWQQQQQQHTDVTEAPVVTVPGSVVSQSLDESAVDTAAVDDFDGRDIVCCDDVVDESAAGGPTCPNPMVECGSFSVSGAVEDGDVNAKHPSEEVEDGEPVGEGERNAETPDEDAERKVGTESQAESVEEDDLVRCTVHRLLTTSPLGHLFNDFCYYYGFVFNYDTQGLRFGPDGSSLVVPKPQQCQQRGQHLYMTSPFDVQYDITAHMMHTRAFQELCCMFVPLTNPLPLLTGDGSNVCTLRQVLEWISPDTAHKELIEVHNAVQMQQLHHGEVQQVPQVNPQLALENDRCTLFPSSRGRLSSGIEERSTSPSQLNFPDDGNELSSGGRSLRPRDQSHGRKGGKNANASSGLRDVNDGSAGSTGSSRGGKGLPANGTYVSDATKGRSGQPVGWRQGKRSEGDSEDVGAETRTAAVSATSPASEVSSAMDAEVSVVSPSPFPNAPLASGSKMVKGAPAMGDVNAGNCDPTYVPTNPTHANVLPGQQPMNFVADPSLSMFMFPPGGVNSPYPGMPQYYHPMPYTTEAQLHFRPDAYQQHPMAPFVYQGYDMNQMFPHRVMGDTTNDSVVNATNTVVTGKRQSSAYGSSTHSNTQSSARSGVSGNFLSRGRGRSSHRGSGSNNNGGEKASQYKAGHSDALEEQAPTPVVSSPSLTAEPLGTATFGGLTSSGINRDSMTTIAVGTVPGKEHQQQPLQSYVGDPKEWLKPETPTQGIEFHHYSHQTHRQASYPHHQQSSAPQHYHHHIQSSPKMRSNTQQQAQGHWRHQRCTMMMVPSPMYSIMSGMEGTATTSLCSPAQAGSPFQKQAAGGGSVFSSASQGATSPSGFSMSSALGMPDCGKVGNVVTDNHQQHSYHHHHHHFIHHNVHIQQRWPQPLGQQQRAEGTTTNTNTNTAAATVTSVGSGNGGKGAGGAPRPVATQSLDGRPEEFSLEKIHQQGAGDTNSM